MTISTTLQINNAIQNSLKYAHDMGGLGNGTVVDFAKKEYLINIYIELALGADGEPKRKEYDVKIDVEGVSVIDTKNIFIGNSWGAIAFIIEEIEQELKRQNKGQ